VALATLAVASVDEPTHANGHWILALNGVPKARISADVASVLKTLDGERSAEEVAQLLGSPWTAPVVRGIAEQLAPTGAFDVTGPSSDGRRIQFRAPLTVQVTLFNPTAFLRLFRPAVASVAGTKGAVLAAALVVAGVVGAVIAGPDVWRVLSTPLALEAYIYVAAAMFASTLLHELGHGMALVHFGGTPRRIGIMLFYLAPAFFCDVTDGWRLRSHWQRVMVALAGPLVHLDLGSMALVAASFIPASPCKDAAVLYGLLCYAVAVLQPGQSG
jgi:putative peptide zinc metalloprotease protein